MTAAAAARVTPERASKPFAATKSIPVKTATTIWQGTMVAIDATGYAVPAATDTDHRIQGVATETVVNAGASGAKYVKVAIGTFMMNNSAAADAIAVTERGSECYIVDDNTVAKTDGTGTRSRAGNIEAVESAGVWVSIHPYGMPNGQATKTGAETLTNKTLTAPVITGAGMPSLGDASFTANDCALALAGANSGGFYEIDTTAGASTVSFTAGTGLAAGDHFYFVADGTKNGHTVTYQDGATPISAAATASKRHVTHVIYDGTNFYAQLVVGP